MRPAVAIAVAATVSCVSSGALANGRFPRAERLLEARDDPDHLVLAATYGLVTTRDRGATWHHICEKSFSLQDIAFLGDPVVDLVGDDLFVGVQSSLNVSRDDGCHFERSLFDAHQFVQDFTIVRSTRAILAVVEATDGTASQLEESTDGGANWNIVGGPLPTGLALTVDVAPADPARIYVSALASDAQGELLVSSDHGSTWTKYPIPSTGVNEVPYIAFVHPTDSDELFVRTDAWTNRDVKDTANDALLHSTDRGATWRELVRHGAKIYGVALSPDASTLLVGYGDPFDPSVTIEPAETGIYRSPTDVFSFALVRTGPVSCLSWTRSSIYVCPSRAETGVELAFAEAASFEADANALAPLLRPGDVEGPVVCCPSTAPSVCAEDWATTCALFGSCDGGARDASAARCSEAGPSDGGDGGIESTVASNRTGCGCSTPGGSVKGCCALTTLVAATALSRLLRRRRVRLGARGGIR